jgi:hypothetical protein
LGRPLAQRSDVIRGGTAQAEPPSVAVVVEGGVDLEAGRAAGHEGEDEPIQRQAEPDATRLQVA